MVGRFALLSRSHAFKYWISLQSGDPSEQAIASKITTNAPVSAASAAAENVKSFVAGGFGVCVQSWSVRGLMCYTVAILACLIMHIPSGFPTRSSV